MKFTYCVHGHLFKILVKSQLSTFHFLRSMYVLYGYDAFIRMEMFCALHEDVKLLFDMETFLVIWKESFEHLQKLILFEH